MGRKSNEGQTEYINEKKRKTSIVLALATAFCLCACGVKGDVSTQPETDVVEEIKDQETVTLQEPEAVKENEAKEDAEKPPEIEKNGEIYILVTSDVHCGVDQNFGYAGLYEVRKGLEEQGYTTILVDDGDSVQGEAMGTLSKGEISVALMNEMGYDVAIPGNHEFDYGMEQFFKNVEAAKFPYISCNFYHEGERVLEPYKIIEAAGKKIAFIGVTTPESLSSSNPKNFQDKNGNFIYSFCQDDDGSGVYNEVQKAVDAARAEGADYVYVMGHMGLEKTAAPWTYADVIEHTNGIDVFLDGHSHDTEQVVMKNKDGEEVVRCAVGTKMSCIGYSHITEEGIEKTDIWSWPNNIDAPTMLNIQNPMRESVDKAKGELNDILGQKVAKSAVDLTINDPIEKDSMGNPIRMARRGETNLGDLTADAFREMSGADIGMINGGGIRKEINKGDITYGDIIAVFPFGNTISMVEVTGQQIIDALEWGARGIPEENGGFLQVSGLTYEIDASTDSPCVCDENSVMTGITGKRRVSNVMVGDEPIDLSKKYTLASQGFILFDHGDGQAAFDGATVVQAEVGLDNELLINYIKEKLGGEIGMEYEDPYGNGRIIISYNE